MDFTQKQNRASPVWLAVAVLAAGLTVAACDRPSTSTSTTSRTETTTPSGTASAPSTPSNTASSNSARTGSAMAPSDTSKSTTASNTTGAAKAADDSTITTQVKTAIAADSNLKAQQITVETKDQTVTLAGNVETSAQKDRAKEIATGVSGVKRVNDDNLKVKAS